MQIPHDAMDDFHEITQFRLPGYGGAAVFLRSQIQPAHAFGSDLPVLAFDVMLLSPEYHAWYLARPAEPGFVDRLSRFLFAAAADFHPEASVATLQDESLGLTLAVVSSTDDRVGLELSIVTDPDADVAEFDGLNFETSRATLAACAQSIRALDGSWLAEDLTEGFTL